MITVGIPTHARPDLLDRCLKSLAAQRIEGFDAEVIVGIDGADTGEVACAERWSCEALPVRAIPGDHAGPAATRNRIIDAARGETLLLLNDDVEAAPGLLTAHHEAQRELSERGRVAMVLGSAPWAIVEPDRVLDRLTRETSLIFFYDQMTGAGARDPDHDWGWRHAWTLNLSLPMRCIAEAGGFCESMRRPVYEDIELAFRVRARFGAPTLYRPSARVTHHHRYEPVALLAREYVLGHQSRRLAQVAPECARELFRESPLDERVVQAAWRRVGGEREEAAGAVEAFIAHAHEPASSVDAEGLRIRYEKYVRCRSYLRAMGLADAGLGRECAPPIPWLTELEACAMAH